MPLLERKCYNRNITMFVVKETLEKYWNIFIDFTLLNDNVIGHERIEIHCVYS